MRCQVNVDAFAADLQRLVQTLQQHGVAVVLVTHANRFGRTVAPDDKPVMGAWRKFYPMLSEHGLLDMEARMSDAVRQVGVNSGYRGDHPSTCRARSAAATSAGGSPGRRGPSFAGIGLPVTSSAVRITSRTL